MSLYHLIQTLMIQSESHKTDGPESSLQLMLQGWFLLLYPIQKNSHWCLKSNHAEPETEKTVYLSC